MTSDGYDRYYKYHYRIDRDNIKGTDNETKLDQNFESARRFGAGLGKTYSKFFGKGMTIDVGSSTGGVLYGLREAHPELRIFGIEPSESESEFARKKGVPTQTVLFEDYKGQFYGNVANVLCVQSLNHLLDPASFLKWSWNALQDGGHIFLAVKNFRHQVRRAGSLEAGIQIDHVYMFTPETLLALVEAAGFEVAYMDVDEGKGAAQIAKQKSEGFNIHHIRLIAHKAQTSSMQNDHLSGNYRSLRLAFWRPWLKIYYCFRYSSRLAFLRRVLHIGM